MRPGCENVWPVVLSMAIICLSLPEPLPEESVMPFTTVPRLDHDVPLSVERATTIDAPLAPALLCEISM